MGRIGWVTSAPVPRFIWYAAGLTWPGGVGLTGMALTGRCPAGGALTGGALTGCWPAGGALTGGALTG
jgi:hypothetical protein